MNSTDGTIDWTGGMDSARLPHLIESNKSHRLCNVRVSEENGQLSHRYGITHIKLIGEEDAVCIYNNCRNLQGEGWYRHNNNIILVRVIDGWIIELNKVSESTYSASIRNRDDRRNRYASKAWVTTVPRGVIINDGQAYPHIVRKDSIRRSDPSNNGIYVGKMGIYTQNRFFYVDASGKYIYASDFRNPESMEESYVTNIYGFILPDDDDTITAIGVRKQTLNYVEGGTLSFSSINNTYSVDVRGDRQKWELGNNRLGKVQESIPGIGAVSSYSYEPFSSNLYFRSINNGIVDLRTAQEDFQTGGTYSGHTSEILSWLNADTTRLLSKCYTRKFRNRLFTTIAPKLNKHGYIYWSGMVSELPMPMHANQKLPPIHEGLITGIRPWCITSFMNASNGDDCFVDSYDIDGVTRLYRIEPDKSYDTNHMGERIEIEGWIESRSYTFGDLASGKMPEAREYSLIDIPRDLDVTVYSRTDHRAEWVKFYDATHHVSNCDAASVNPMQCGAYNQARTRVSMPQEVKSDRSTAGDISGTSFLMRQYRFAMKGAYSFVHFIIRAKEDKLPTTLFKKEEKNSNKINRHNPLLDYSYNIAASHERTN